MGNMIYGAVLVHIIFWIFLQRNAKVLSISVDMEQKRRLELEKQVFNIKMVDC